MRNIILEFKTWLEYSLEQRVIRDKFLRRLGFDADATKDTSVSSMRVNSYEKRILKSLDSFGLTEEKAEELKNWVKNNPQSTLQDLINQMDYIDFVNPEEPGELPGEKGKLPKTDKNLPTNRNEPPAEMDGMPQQRNSQDMQFMGNPPRQGNMQNPF